MPGVERAWAQQPGVVYVVLEGAALLQLALDELPAEQREVFIEHEINGISFKDMEAKTGVNVATLISRKRYAVLHLRQRLRILKDELLNY